MTKGTKISEYTIIYSIIDLNVELIGENKLVCKETENILAIYTGDNYLGKDLSFDGDGSLTIEFQNINMDAADIYAADLTIGSNITITTPNCENIVNGVVCNFSLIVSNNAIVTVNNSAAKHSKAVVYAATLSLKVERRLMFL